MRTAFPATVASNVDEDSVWGSSVVHEPNTDLLICDLSNGGERVWGTLLFISFPYLDRF